MFVMLVFAFFAIAGVAIDVGMAGITQQHMQVAVDTAAIEGLRLRQAERYMHHSDLNVEHRDRRAKTSQMVRLVFDDDLHPTGTPWATNDPQDLYEVYDTDADHMNFGAGPAMQMPGEVGKQTIQMSPDSPVWDDPKLRWNEENKAWGDMVSGTFLPDGAPTENVTGDYERSDFEPAVDGSDAQHQSLAFLVRMRRTPATNPRDKDLGATYFSRTVPLIFGIGSLIQFEQDGYDPRKRGFTVRATAIAAARPALRASPPPRNPDGTSIPDEGQFNHHESAPQPMLGLYPFAVSRQFWEGSGAWGGAAAEFWHDPIYLEMHPDGRLTHNLAGTAPSVLNPALELAGTFAEYGTSVGQAITPLPQGTIGADQATGYVAIYEDIAGPGGNVRRVIGYGFCQAPLSNDFPGTIRFSSGITTWGTAGEMNDAGAWIGANGVSARLDAMAPNLNAQEWETVLAMNRSLAYPGGAITYDYEQVRPGTLLAATLAR